MSAWSSHGVFQQQHLIVNTTNITAYQQRIRMYNTQTNARVMAQMSECIESTNRYWQVQVVNNNKTGTV